MTYQGHNYTAEELQTMREILMEQVTATNPVNYANLSDIDVIQAVNELETIKCTLTVK